MALVEKTFKKVQHIIPIRGHSVLPCDRDFGTVEKHLRRYDRMLCAWVTSLITNGNNNIKTKISWISKIGGLEFIRKTVSLELNNFK